MAAGVKFDYPQFVQSYSMQLFNSHVAKLLGKAKPKPASAASAITTGSIPAESKQKAKPGRKPGNKPGPKPGLKALKKAQANSAAAKELEAAKATVAALSQALALANGTPAKKQSQKKSKSPTPHVKCT